MKRIVIAGSRDFEDYLILKGALDRILTEDEDDIELVSGHAKGADLLAERYAAEHGLPIHVIKPNWKAYGRAAGPIRNRQILEYAMCARPQVIAFWDGISKGTKNTIETARKMGINVETILFSQEAQPE